MSKAVIAAVILFLAYAFLILVLEVSETCTMGSDGLNAHLIIGAPLAAIAALLMLFAVRGQREYLSKRLSLSVVPAVAVVLVFHLSQAWNVSVLGHHSCGSDYDLYLEFTSKFERLTPLVLLSIDVVVGWLVARSLAIPNRA